MREPSVRAAVVTRRTYNRPLNDAGTEFETWSETVDRVVEHQKWLWERAKGGALTNFDHYELGVLRRLVLERKVSVSGRTLWLGGTEVSKTREASQFNCSFGKIETVHDIVDAFWLLLQGCGVGFEPVTGVLNGFAKPVNINVTRSRRTDKGRPTNATEIFTDALSGERVFYLEVGDSAEAWAKALGKLLALKDPVDRIEIDFGQVRPAGTRLKGYGWISSGDETFWKALVEIAEILNQRAGQLLTRIDILDILNWMGTTLSSRRSAEIALVPVDDPEAEEFALAKKEHWERGKPQRAQSNNSLLFHRKPTRTELLGVFDKMMDAGGSEPGFYNAEAAKRRAPWFKGTNPCGEILLGNKSFCNLVEVDLQKFIDDPIGLYTAIETVARANYRQTCVNLDDGVLQRTWHELNQFLRLCGVGLTGIVPWLEHNGDAAAKELRDLRKIAQYAANRMADELGLPRPKAVTTVKPSGTLSKIMDTTEGVHRPLGKYIFNNIRFASTDPMLPKLSAAGYRVFPDPYASDAMLVTFPVAYENVKFGTDGNGKAVNNESAIDQLERYKLLQENWADHNCSVSIYYDPSEVPAIVEWLLVNWDIYCGVSFIYRTDASKTAEDLGYPYLPQEVVVEETYREYVAGLQPVEGLDQANSFDELIQDDCATGACPIR